MCVPLAYGTCPLTMNKQNSSEKHTQAAVVLHDHDRMHAGCEVPLHLTPERVQPHKPAGQMPVSVKPLVVPAALPMLPRCSHCSTAPQPQLYIVCSMYNTTDHVPECLTQVWVTAKAMCFACIVSVWQEGTAVCL